MLTKGGADAIFRKIGLPGGRGRANAAGMRMWAGSGARGWYLALVATVCAGCATLPQVPVSPTDAVDFESVVELMPPGVENDPSVPLSVYPGDVVTLRLVSARRTEEAGLTVDERGILHVPLAGDVAVGGLSLTAAEKRIEEAMKPYDANVRAGIVLAEPLGQRATVIGAVQSPGRIDVVPGMRLADLFAAAGGPATAEHGGAIVGVADLYTARLVRGGKALPVSIARALTGDPKHNIYIRPGDHLYVPVAFDSFISVVGEVHSGMVIAYQEGLRLSRALALAGGPTRDAHLGNVVIVRGAASGPKAYVARFDDLLAGSGFDPILAPGDIVYVSSTGLAHLRDVMTVITPLVGILTTTGFGVASIYLRP